MPLLFILLVTSLVTLSACCMPARIGHGWRGTPDPIWTTDLRPLGFYERHMGPAGAFTAVRQIAFGSDKELVVIGDQGSLPDKPNPVRAYVLDAGTGKVAGQKDWDSHEHAYVFATASGNYVVNTSDRIRLYSSGLTKIIKKMDDSAVDASPDGRSITVWDGVPGHAVTRFLDADTLEPTGAEFVNKAVDSVAFNKIVFIGYRNMAARGQPPRVSPYASVFIEGARKSSHYDTSCKEVRPRFVSNDVLAVFGCGRLDLITVEGEVLFTTRVSEASSWLAPASRNGRRFALLSTYESAAHWPKTCFERVDVFDVAMRDFVFRGEIRTCGGTEGQSGVALSPDGRLLAVNSQGLVQMFGLPGPGEGQAR